MDEHILSVPQLPDFYATSHCPTLMAEQDKHKGPRPGLQTYWRNGLCSLLRESHQQRHGDETGRQLPPLRYRAVHLREPRRTCRRTDL